MSEENLHYNLESPFKYAFKGDTRTASFITLLPPTMKQQKYAASLKQSIMRAARSDVAESTSKAVEKDTEDTTEAEITAELVLALIFGSVGMDVNVIFGQAKDLFTHGAALVDGEEKLTIGLIDKMSVDDFQNLTGDYIANFTLA